MSILALIPARGGSKRVPRKNLRELGGQPLLVWTFGAALLSPSLDKIILSSEDDEILDLANRYGVRTLRRPPHLAKDDTPMYPVIHHALNALDESFDHLCLLHPTSPFRLPQDIEACIHVVRFGDAPACATAEQGMAVPNGAVYVGRTDWLRDGGNFDSIGVERVYMPPERSIDIDTAADWSRAADTMRLAEGLRQTALN